MCRKSAGGQLAGLSVLLAGGVRGVFSVLLAGEGGAGVARLGGVAGAGRAAVGSLLQAPIRAVSRMGRSRLFFIRVSFLISNSQQWPGAKDKEALVLRQTTNYDWTV